VVKLIPPTQKTERVLTKEEVEGHHIHIETKDNDMFPPVKEAFDLVADGKTIRTKCRWVIKGKKMAIQDKLGQWFRAHPELKKGTKVEIEVIEPMKRYRLKIVYVEELPGVNTQGKTLKEAREHLKEAPCLIIEANKEQATKSQTYTVNVTPAEAGV
jgi:hypothetical protein